MRFPGIGTGLDIATGSKRGHIGSGHCNGVETGVDIHSKLHMAYCYGSREQRIAMARSVNFRPARKLPIRKVNYETG